MDATRSSTRRPATFFVLVLALSVPFWVIGGSIAPAAIPIDLPASSLQFVCPLVAAVVLLHRE